MFLRTTILAVSLCSAVLAVQFPAFSQQYIQRLGGAVDALGEVVADFDASAAALGLTRDAALAQMQGTAFVDARRADMQRAFTRHAALQADLSVLQGQGPLMRAYRVRHMADAEVARGAWQSFEPALPLSLTSLVFALAGFASGFVASHAILRLCRLRRRPVAMAA